MSDVRSTLLCLMRGLTRNDSMSIDNQMTLDGVIAVRGGIPLIEHGTIIRAIGCSGGASSRMSWSAR